MKWITTDMSNFTIQFAILQIWIISIQNYEIWKYMLIFEKYQIVIFSCGGRYTNFVELQYNYLLRYLDVKKSKALNQWWKSTGICMLDYPDAEVILKVTILSKNPLFLDFDFLEIKNHLTSW